MDSLRFDPVLVESVVTAEAARNTELASVYHRRTDPFYEELLPSERAAAFDRLHAQLFGALGFGESFSAPCAELPALAARAPALLVLAARHKQEEGAVIGRDGQSVCLRVMSARFAVPERLRAFVRHELLHAADMLDEAFGYPRDDAERPAVSCVPEALIEPFGVLWCAHVDARLARRGVAPLAPVESHRRAFAQCFGASAAAALERVCNAQSLSHVELLSLASAHTEHRRARAPGARCPLCKFLTHQWAHEVPVDVAALIRADFQAWQTADGACERCVERYSFLTKSAEPV